MAEVGGRLMPARCPPQRLEPLRRMRVSITSLDGWMREIRRSRRPVSGLAGVREVQAQPWMAATSCIGRIAFPRHAVA
jgi:hypothetical protein